MIQLPKHLVVIGGSYIGLEFAQMYRRFGADVTIVEKGPRLVAREDEDVSDAIKDILEGEGIACGLMRNVSRLNLTRRVQRSVSIAAAGSQRVVGSHVLLAIGRRPNTDDLGLDRAGVVTG